MARELPTFSHFAPEYYHTYSVIISAFSPIFILMFSPQFLPHNLSVWLHLNSITLSPFTTSFSKANTYSPRFLLKISNFVGWTQTIFQSWHLHSKLFLLTQENIRTAFHGYLTSIIHNKLNQDELNYVNIQSKSICELRQQLTYWLQNDIANCL